MATGGEVRAATVLRMLVAVIVLAVAALILAAGWFSARRGLGSLSAQHETTSQNLSQTKAELESATSSHAADVSRFEATEAELTTKLDDVTGELEAEKAAHKAESERVIELDAELAEAKATISETETARDAASTRADELHEQVNALIDDRDGLRNEIDRAKQAPALVLPEASSNGTAAPQDTLWKLELARSERTWAHSVAVNPESDESPFDASDDLVRTAVEIEASALREEVGAFITIEWDAPPSADPGRQHLVLRVAQEILAAAAREPEASTLRVSGGSASDSGDSGTGNGEAASGDVVLELVATDDDTQVINLIAPQFDHELVDVASAQGLKVTVKSS